ncbi:hypothetical protein INS49_008345 [Diaporthe citri]|uniref:uncharacterized protein n=1 Tax=Diaporthe citri TaxID=83186 RepID=UPI001C80EE3B|nr:uncharacterized protein INS49_008345 [Diaporthe citri]KAG6363249.1 hypothetical protein INS49_008345 [Diaporthe citri]
MENTNDDLQESFNTFINMPHEDDDGKQNHPANIASASRAEDTPSTTVATAAVDMASTGGSPTATLNQNQDSPMNIATTTSTNKTNIATAFPLSDKMKIGIITKAARRARIALTNEDEDELVGLAGSCGEVVADDAHPMDVDEDVDDNDSRPLARPMDVDKDVDDDDSRPLDTNGNPIIADDEDDQNQANETLTKIAETASDFTLVPGTRKSKLLTKVNSRGIIEIDKLKAMAVA